MQRGGASSAGGSYGRSSAPQQIDNGGVIQVRDELLELELIR